MPRWRPLLADAEEQQCCVFLSDSEHNATVKCNRMKSQKVRRRPGSCHAYHPKVRLSHTLTHTLLSNIQVDVEASLSFCIYPFSHEPLLHVFLMLFACDGLLQSSNSVTTATSAVNLLTGKCEGLRRRLSHLRLTLPLLVLAADIVAAAQLDALMEDRRSNRVETVAMEAGRDAFQEVGV